MNPMNHTEQNLAHERVYTFAMNPAPSKGEMYVLFAGSEHTLPSHRVGPQVLDYYLIHYIIEGHGSFHCMGRTYELTAGDQFVIFPNELITYQSSEKNPWKYCWVGFRGQGVEQILSQIGVSVHQPIIRSADFTSIEANPQKIVTRLMEASQHLSVVHTIASWFRIIENTLREHATSCDLVSSAYLRLLLAEIQQHKEPMKVTKPQLHPQQLQVERAIQWMKWQYAKPITIEQMASALGYHRTHLAKIFKAYTGVTPIQYLIKLRMEKAKTLLFEHLTIEQVANAVGYEDPLYFSKQFKQTYQLAPSEYRLKKQLTAYDCKQ